MTKRREAGNDLGGGLFMRWDGGRVEGFRAGHVTRLEHKKAPRRFAGVSLVKTRVVSEHTASNSDLVNIVLIIKR